MTCPVCNEEISAQSSHCECCGASTNGVASVPLTEIAHCTYCGAREDQESTTCLSCGLKKNFKTSETGIGTCRNCGVLWRNTWLYCRPCGVARDNGLISSIVPVPVEQFSVWGSPGFAFNSVMRGAEVSTALPESAITARPYPKNPDRAPVRGKNLFPTQPLSESEVVKRMFGHPPQEEGDEFEETLLPAFPEFPQAPHPVASDAQVVEQGTEVPGAYPAIEPGLSAPPLLDLRFPEEEIKSHHVNGHASTAPAIFEELPLPVDEDLTEFSEENSFSDAAPADEIALEKSAESPLSARNEATSFFVPAPPEEKKTYTGPVQTVKVLNKPRSGATPLIDKRLVQIIGVLIALILLFSALIVSGVRVRDFFNLFKKGRLGAMSLHPLRSASLADTKPPTVIPDGMVYIPGGVFWMGVDKGDSYESPAHEVMMKAYFLDRTEVTNEQYAQFLSATNHFSPVAWQNGKMPPGTEKYPVVNVSWNDAQAYAKWAEKRLPTEAEWEFGARSIDERTYAWGNTWDASQANTSESNLNHAVEVGQYSSGASPFGAYDMTGNVWEWIDGEIVSYQDTSLTLAPGKVIRGGAYYLPKEHATTTYRAFVPPDKISEKIGFRCVKDTH